MQKVEIPVSTSNTSLAALKMYIKTVLNCKFNAMTTIIGDIIMSNFYSWNIFTVVPSFY